jgi:hypothetical protein
MIIYSQTPCSPPVLTPQDHLVIPTANSPRSRRKEMESVTCLRCHWPNAQLIDPGVMVIGDSPGLNSLPLLDRDAAGSHCIGRL